MILLAALDLDGTLLNERFELTPAVVHAFRDAVQAGLQVVVVTGRDKRSAWPFLLQLEAERTSITSGGAQVWLNDELIWQASFTLQQVRDILALGLQHAAGMYIDQPHQTRRYGKRYYTDLYGHISDSLEIERPDDLLDPLPFKISIIQEPPVLDLIRARLSATYPSFTITHPFHQVLDVNPEGCSKGTALTRLAASLGISLRNTAVAGDSENDLSMFAAAGLTYAMGNAASTLRACADFVAPTNDDDGAAWILQDIMGEGCKARLAGSGSAPDVEPGT